MKDPSSGNEVIHKEVVIIGNGPSGISLSSMLHGLVPHLISCDHPDEMLSARLHMTTPSKSSSKTCNSPQLSLAQQQSLLEELAIGLEGRTTNPVSLLLDALEHPCADLGVEMKPLIVWREHIEHQIDHVVLGKGPPGGSWHTMDPNVLTLSLGSWMALPGIPYTQTECTDSQRRASAGNVAKYYQQYVTEMGLEPYFKNATVIKIERINSVEYREGEKENSSAVLESNSPNNKRKCSFVNALNFIRARTKCHKQKAKEQLQLCPILNRTCKRPREILSKTELITTPNHHRKLRDRYSRENSNDPKIPEDIITCDVTYNFYDNKIRSLSFSCDSDYEISTSCDRTFKQLVVDDQKHNSLLNISDKICQCVKENYHENNTSGFHRNARWMVTAYNQSTKQQVTYTCTNLVLANGASDLPNRLGLAAETYDLPWILHDLRTLEDKLDEFSNRENTSKPDPVLVIGAGLSAADAVIATRFRNIPVLHVFRNKSVALDKQLPENMYPEYHKVHQMMLDGGSTYPLYTALPEHSVSDINTSTKTVTITSKSGQPMEHKVSFVVILIGSRPNLSFLPSEISLGVNKGLHVDAKNNPVDINRLTHAVNGYDGLYTIGPLAGDNFVRFIPGGALAVVADLYKQKNW